MLLRDLIREYTQSRTELPPAPPARPVPQTHVCPKCKMESGRTAVEQGAMICPACGAYFRMNARERITHTFDAGSFQELDADVTSVDFLSFPGYAEKLEKARKTTGENEAVLCGTAAIGGMFCATFVMDSSFIMASMGSAVGEKITRLFEFALAQRLPVIGFTASGGALALAAADRVYMLENAVYSVISPEGCASILWKDSGRVADAAQCLHITAADMVDLHVAEEIIPENFADFPQMCAAMTVQLTMDLDELCALSPEELLEQRYRRYRRIGVYEENGSIVRFTEH